MNDAHFDMLLRVALWLAGDFGEADFETARRRPDIEQIRFRIRGSSVRGREVLAELRCAIDETRTVVD
jgi:hypothetical protein